MSNERTQEVLYESEAALRLVDQELHDLHELHDLQEGHREEQRVLASGLADLPQILERANAQILGVLARLRESRAGLRSCAVEKLQVTHEKLREVTSATEDAAINIMDACDRATGLVDQLDAIDAQPQPDRALAGAVRRTLRDELFVMMGALQFQDITAQQLNHASAVLVDMEQRLMQVAKLFDISSSDTSSHRSRLAAPDAATFDENASTLNAETRQALADEIFTVVRAPAA